jgi:anaerobic selenocysteine-containing dehydrogenase
MSTTMTTYCRLCPAACGLQVELDEGRVIKITGDEQQALTRGFTCIKGRHLGDFSSDPGRLLQSQRKVAPGVFEDIAFDAAIDEIATRLTDIIDTHGPDAVALYTGTQASMASLTLPFTYAFWKTIGSRKRFSSMTVDQAAKWVTEDRLGRWAAGAQRFDEADVWILVGTNPLVSMQGGYFTGFPIHDGFRRLAEERKRGLQLIVIDPRRTEVANHADIHLQLLPGTDAALFAGLINIMLTEQLHDPEFCARWAPGVEQLRVAVAPFTAALTAAVCGVVEADLVTAARMFGRASRGMVTSGTGPDMGPWANLAEHLIQTTNVICGRFPRAGDRVAGTAVLGSAKPVPAQAISPRREWERGWRSDTGYGLLQNELPAVTLPQEITGRASAGVPGTPGTPGTPIKALIVSGGNPLVAVPGKNAMAEAFGSLELLVTIDPFMSETAQLADYVIAPVMHLERPDSTRSYESLMDKPFAQYTPAVLPAPAGVIDDWEFFLRLTWAMGKSLHAAGKEYAPGSALPSTDDVLASFSARGRVTLADVRDHQHGRFYDDLEPVRAVDATDGVTDTFDVMPHDVAAELAQVERAATHQRDVVAEGRLLLVVRRAKEVVNSAGTQLAGLVRTPRNPIYVHPDDLARLGVEHGSRVRITSAHGTIETVAQRDATMRVGVVAMTHGFGGPGASGDPSGAGASTNRLISADSELQPISAMPMLTAIPVSLTPLERVRSSA